MGTARESSRGTFVIAECWDPVKRPKEMVFTCADADFTARGLSWKRWTRTSAKGTGRFECHGMTCNWERRGRITLWDRSYCGNIHRHVFMKGRVVLRRPVQGQDTMRVYPGCGFQE